MRRQWLRHSIEGNDFSSDKSPQEKRGRHDLAIWRPQPVRQSLTAPGRGESRTTSRRVVIVPAGAVIVLFFRWRLALLIPDVQHAAIAIFIDAVEPAAT